MPVSPTKNANKLTQAARKLECTQPTTLPKISACCLAGTCFIARAMYVPLDACDCEEKNGEFRVCDVLGTGIFGCCLSIRILYHENIDYSSGSRLHMPSSSTFLPNVFHICRENIRGNTSISNV